MWLPGTRQTEACISSALRKALGPASSSEPGACCCPCQPLYQIECYAQQLIAQVLHWTGPLKPWRQHGVNRKLWEPHARERGAKLLAPLV